MAELTPEFKLTEIEKQSALWKKIETELSRLREVNRTRLENDYDVRMTDRIRGELKVIKTIISWAENDPTF